MCGLRHFVLLPGPDTAPDSDGDRLRHLVGRGHRGHFDHWIFALQANTRHRRRAGNRPDRGGRASVEYFFKIVWPLSQPRPEITKAGTNHGLWVFILIRKSIVEGKRWSVRVDLG